MLRILVIDDDPAAAHLLKRGLSYEGFAGDTAASGAEELTIARRLTRCMREASRRGGRS